MATTAAIPSPTRWADDADNTDTDTDTDFPPLPDGWLVAGVSPENEWKIVPAKRRQNRVSHGLNKGKVIQTRDNTINLNKIYKNN